jgi:hypothetical protein
MRETLREIFSPREKTRMRGKVVSKGQGAICFFENPLPWLYPPQTFGGCTSLTCVMIPDSVTNIERDSVLQRFTMDELPEPFLSVPFALMG